MAAMQVTTKELNSGIGIVYGCFMEGGDSVLSIFSGELL